MTTATPTLTPELCALVITTTLRDHGLDPNGIYEHMSFKECVEKFYAGDQKAALVNLMFALMED
jgi:hypothetical protein